jgi:putative ABC transport system permease protein
LFGLALVWLSTLGANAVLANMETGLVLGLSASDALTGILVSAGIGLLAGIMPALQAARMNPVDAMRAR